MDRLGQLRVFIAVAEEQGFAAAARKLQTSPPAVTRMVAALESSLGVQLLVRTTRAVRVTDAGQQYLEHARQILDAMQAADEAVSGESAAPRGKVNVTAPALFGRLHVLPIVIEYLNTYPETEVETLFVDRLVDFVDDGLDIGIRIGELPDSSLRATRVGEVRSVLVASPGYLKLNGIPESPDALKQHTIVASSAGEFSRNWKFSDVSARGIRVNPRLTTTTNDAAIEAAALGFGITRVVSYQVTAECESGELKRILQDWEPAPLPVHIVHREGRFTTGRIRTLIELLKERLSQVLLN